MSIPTSNYLSQFTSLAIRKPQADFSTIAENARKLTSVNWNEDGKVVGNNVTFLAGLDHYDFYFAGSEGARTLEIRRRGNNGFDERVPRSGIPAGERIKIDLTSPGSLLFADRSELSIQSINFFAELLNGSEPIRMANSMYADESILYRLNPTQRDYIEGGDGNDQIRASGGIVGQGINVDIVNGGAGWDTLFLEGEAKDYIFVKNGSGITIRYKSEELFVTSVEQVRFLGATKKIDERFKMDDLVNSRRWDE